MNKFWFIFIVFYCLSLGLKGQTTLDYVKIDGVKYHIHVVEKGHTLYAISKVYAIPIEDIVAANPGVEEGLQIGQELRIPKSGIDRKVLRQNPPQLISGQLIHQVSTGETLYGIAKQYHLSIEEIAEQNPQVTGGLKVGMQLKINPVVSEVDDQMDIQPALPDDFIIHEVKEKESLYGISKTYGVSIDSLVQINPALVNGLKAGMTIYIPLTQEQLDQKVSTTDTILIKRKEKYHIALLLPFDLAATDTLFEEHKLYNKPLQLSRNSQYAIEFYNGFMLAIDSLKAQGFSANIYSFDLGKNPEDAKALINSGDLNGMDLIIGPFYSSTFQTIVEFADTSQITVISPIDQPNRLLLKHSRVTETVPSQTTQIDFLAKHFKAVKDTGKLLVFYNDEARSRIIEERFQHDLKTFGAPVTALKLNPTLQFNGKKGALHPELIRIINTLDSNRVNHIFMASVNYGFVLPLFSLMNGLDTSVFKIRIYGLDPLKNSDQINNYSRHRYKLTLSATHKLDYSNLDVHDFLNLYHSAYQGLPSSSGYAQKGFDIALYFGSLIVNYGLNFSDRYEAVPQYQGLTSRFKFESVGEQSGFENRGLYLIYYENYEVKVME